MRTGGEPTCREDVRAAMGSGRRPLMPRAERVAKRGLDALGAIVGLAVLSPMLVVIALLIVIDSPGPVFFRAERVGFRGRPLRMLKFRKMRVDSAGPLLTVRNDARLTRVGRVLARTRLDELPQLWHVLRGEMSLVGPRPEDPRFVACHLPEYREILAVRPGLTGWTQLAFADEASILAPNDPVGHYVDSILPQKVALDLRYARHARLSSDARILWWTLLAVVLGAAVAVDRSTGEIRRRPRSVEVGSMGVADAVPVVTAVAVPEAALSTAVLLPARATARPEEAMTARGGAPTTLADPL